MLLKHICMSEDVKPSSVHRPRAHFTHSPAAHMVSKSVLVDWLTAVVLSCFLHTLVPCFICTFSERPHAKSEVEAERDLMIFTKNWGNASFHFPGGGKFTSAVLWSLNSEGEREGLPFTNDRVGAGHLKGRMGHNSCSGFKSGKCPKRNKKPYAALR